MDAQKGGLVVDWYYAKDDQQLGPIDQAQIDALVGQGAIGLSTLVWNQDMGDWQPYGEVATQAPSAAVAGGTASCAECGRSFPTDEMVSYSGSYVCAECKPIFFQRVREGVPLDQGFEYGGFWIRFGAKIIDGIILSVAQVPIVLLVGMSAASSPDSAGAVSLLYNLISVGLQMAYTVFFLGKFAATPGKMLCGLKVVRPTGERITYLRALGRWFAELLSSIIFLIGYIMAAFDDEKRTLHDRICDTRVVRTR